MRALAFLVFLQRGDDVTRALRGEILSALATAIGLDERGPEAERHLNLSIRLLEEEYGPMDHRLAGALSTLAVILRNQGRHEEEIAANARALAGAKGDTAARIYTTCMQAQLLSIAGVYRTGEAAVPKQLDARPAMAWLDGDALLVEPLSS